MKKNSLYYMIVLLCAVVQVTWAQTPTPSTELEPYITTLGNRMVYKFNYPSTSVTGEPVVLSSLLCCWAPSTPPENAAIESVHLYSHKLSDYFEQSFLDTGIMDWLNSKDRSTDDINTAWLNQIDKGTATVGGKTYPAPANMSEMFIKKQVPGMIWGTQDVAWAKLDKIFTPGFYNYMKDPANFTNAPALTGNAYEDMHYALESNNVCSGWQPKHRIQFAHSKGDMVVPYGNYLAFRDAHLDGENI